MSGIQLEQVSKRFGSFTAVDALDLEIADGTFTALLGPSGCGKTTTMNMIAGLETPSSGSILFDGARVNDLDPGRRDIGFVFQSYAIFTHLTARANIGFGLRVRKLDAATVESEVTRVARLLEIEHLLDRRATQLSVNDLQKVAIGRSMIGNPRIFLLDEPFSNLDAAFRTYMRAELKKLQRELSQTMIYVTHDQVEAMSMAEQIAIMNQGKLEQYGSPDAVYNRPRTRFVAEFVGSTRMNFLPAAVAGGETVRVTPLVPGAGAIELAASEVDLAGAGDAITLAVRPEHLTVAGDDADVRGSVSLVEPLGARTVVHVAVGDATVRIVVVPSVRPKIGDTIGVRAARTHVHLFDDASGRSLMRNEAV